MKVYAVRKGDLWLDRRGYDSFTPCWMNEAKARQLAARSGAVVEVYEATKVSEYLIPRVALPNLRWSVG